MTSKPSENPEWAESAASSDVSEPDASRSAGYQFEQDIAHDEVNWQFRTIGRWLDWLEVKANGFDSVKAAIEGTEPGELAIVNSYDPGQAFGSVQDTADASDFPPLETLDDEVPLGVATDGQRVFVSTLVDSSPEGMRFLMGDPDDLTASWTEIEFEKDTSSWSGGGAIAVDGEKVYITWDDEVRAYDAASGDLQWNTTLGDGLVDICTDGEVVFVVRQDSVDELYRLECDDGSTVTSSSSLSEEPVAVASDEHFVYVATWDGVDARLHAFSRNPTYIFSEGGGEGWGVGTRTVALGTDQPIRGGLKADGRRIFVLCEDELKSLRVFDGEEVFSVEYHQADPSIFCCDESRVYVHGNGAVEVYDSLTGEIVGFFWIDPFDITTPTRGIATDGDSLFVCVDNERLERRTLQKRPQLWSRVNSDDIGRRPFHRLLIPSE